MILLLVHSASQYQCLVPRTVLLLATIYYYSTTSPSTTSTNSISRMIVRRTTSHQAVGSIINITIYLLASTLLPLYLSIIVTTAAITYDTLLIYYHYNYQFLPPLQYTTMILFLRMTITNCYYDSTTNTYYYISTGVLKQTNTAYFIKN